MPQPMVEDILAAFRIFREVTMSQTICMLALANDLGKIASETKDSDTAARLIALVNEILIAAGHLPKAPDVGSTDGNGEHR